MSCLTPDQEQPTRYDQNLALDIESAKNFFLDPDIYVHHSYITKSEKYIDLFFPTQNNRGTTISFFRIPADRSDGIATLPVIQLEETDEGESPLPKFPALPRRFDEATIFSSMIQGAITFHEQKTRIFARLITDEPPYYKDFRFSFDHTSQNYGSVEFKPLSNNIEKEEELVLYEYIKNIFNKLDHAQEYNPQKKPQDFSTN